MCYPQIASGTCLRWSLCKAAASVKQPASLSPDSTKALESISVEQPPLYNGHAVRTGPQMVVLARFHCTSYVVSLSHGHMDVQCALCI